VHHFPSIFHDNVDIVTATITGIADARLEMDILGAWIIAEGKGEVGTEAWYLLDDVFEVFMVLEYSRSMLYSDIDENLAKLLPVYAWWGDSVHFANHDRECDVLVAVLDKFAEALFCEFFETIVLDDIGNCIDIKVTAVTLVVRC
jgi:hypothetical protein